MIKRIIFNPKLPFRERMKNLGVYLRMRRGSRIQWKQRYSKLFKIHPEYKRPDKTDVEIRHRSYWKPFKSKINLSTLRVCKNISGISNSRYMPEEIFKVDIEPTLNDTVSVDYLTYKSFYNHWFLSNIFPFDYFHNVDGEWLNNKLEPISINEVIEISKELIYPVVYKPNKGSYGGRNIYFPQDPDELLCLIKKNKNFVVQEKIQQNHFFNRFNPSGLNTVRVNLYRSVKDNKIHITNLVLRMGQGGSLDNETAGGIVAMIKKDGTLNGFAVDKYGKRYFNHPDTGLEFYGIIPHFEELEKTSLAIAHKLFYARIICLDLCFDVNERWRAIEVNSGKGTTIRFAQYHGALFFDEFTEEVYDYCLKNHWALKL